MSSAKISSAAMLALRTSLVIFVSTILMVPPLAIVQRVFNRTWSVPWRPMLTVSGIWTGLVLAFCFLTKILESSAKEHRRLARRMVFPAAMWLRGLHLGSMVMGLGLMGGTYREGNPRWVVVLPVFFVFLGFFARPRAIEITETEIRQTAASYLCSKRSGSVK